MTSDRLAPAPLRFLRLAGAVLAIWFALLSLVTLLVEPTRRVVVIAVSEGAALSAISAAGADLVSGSPLGMIAEGGGRGFVARLYGAGAILVLPALAGGCRGGPDPARPPA